MPWHRKHSIHEHIFFSPFIPVCHFRRGDWSSCDPLLELKNRTDSLKPRSRPGGQCPDSRTVTKRCKPKKGKKNKKDKQRGNLVCQTSLVHRAASIVSGRCVYERSRSVDWTRCSNLEQVRRKVLHLSKVKGKLDCPAEKVLAKACHSKQNIKKETRQGKSMAGDDKKMNKKKLKKKGKHAKRKGWYKYFFELMQH